MKSEYRNPKPDPAAAGPNCESRTDAQGLTALSLSAVQCPEIVHFPENSAARAVVPLVYLCVLCGLCGEKHLPDLVAACRAAPPRLSVSASKRARHGGWAQ